MESKLVWSAEKVRWVDMVPYEKNARKMKAENERNLNDSLEEFGMAVPPTLDYDNLIIGGRQRLMLKKGFGYDLADAMKPNRKLTEAEFKRLNLLLNSKKFQGDYDVELLNQHFSEFNLEEEFGIEMPDFEALMNEEMAGNKEPELPIVQKMSEKYTAFVVVCTNEIDENHLAEKLGIDHMKCYKSSKIGQTHVVMAKRLIEILAPKTAP